MVRKILSKKQNLTIVLFVLLGCLFGACSQSEEDATPTPTPSPEEPVVTTSDTLDVKLVGNVSVSEESLITSRAGSNDLIGVQIYQLTSLTNKLKSYACGVFDDLDKITFKMVKGNHYLIRMNYYPNAKNIVYNYSDGTYGNPFSYLYGLTSYTINEPVYYSGTGSDGNTGDELPQLFSELYQPTEDRYSQSFKRGMTPRYLGELEDVTIEDETQIEIQLYLCMMGITLNVGNFTEGELNMTFEHVDWKIKPGEDTSIQFQIPYNY